MDTQSKYGKLRYVENPNSDVKIIPFPHFITVYGTKYHPFQAKFGRNTLITYRRSSVANDKSNTFKVLELKIGHVHTRKCNELNILQHIHTSLDTTDKHQCIVAIFTESFPPVMSSRNKLFSFVLMEHYGITLKEYMKKNQLRPLIGESVQIMQNVCRSVLDIHSSHVIHNDLKLSNIMIDINLHVKIIDFEGSIIYKPKFKRNQSSYSITTTHPFASPDTKSNRRNPFKYSNDIWSLGVILIYVIAFTLSVTQTINDYITKVVRWTDHDVSTLFSKLGSHLESADRSDTSRTTRHIWKYLVLAEQCMAIDRKRRPTANQCIIKSD